MKALTLHQPWATLIALGVKTIETRSWRTNYRGPIAIHAGLHAPGVSNIGGEFGWDTMQHRSRPDHIYEGLGVTLCNGDWYGYFRPNPPGKVDRFYALPLGAIVATATLTDCVQMYDSRECSRDASPHICITDGLRLLRYPGSIESDWGDDIADQLPYGEFTPGRWAWMLDDIKPTTERCPACGGSCREPDPTTASMFGYLQGWRACSTCHGKGDCPPIPAKGKQGVWKWTP